MANTSSAKKAARKIAARSDVNKSRVARVRTYLRKVEEAIASGDKDKAGAALKAAEPGGLEVVERGNLHRAGAIGDRHVVGLGVEAVVQRDVTGYRVKQSLLCFERGHPAPSGHVPRPLDGLDADVRAAIEREHAVSVVLPAQIDQIEDAADPRRQS